MPCANRFGGPATSFSSNGSRGVICSRDELAERAQLRPGQHTRDEAVEQDRQDPFRVEHHGRTAMATTPVADEPSRDFVDGVRETDDLGHGTILLGRSPKHNAAPITRIPGSTKNHGNNQNGGSATTALKLSRLSAIAAIIGAMSPDCFGHSALSAVDAGMA